MKGGLGSQAWEMLYGLGVGMPKAAWCSTTKACWVSVGCSVVVRTVVIPELSCLACSRGSREKTAASVLWCVGRMIMGRAGLS